MPSLFKTFVRRTVRPALQAVAPGAYEIARRWWSSRFGDPSQVFGAYYADNLWRNGQSRSGPGSTIDFTAVLRERLPPLLEELGVRIFVDAPCGDFNWMKEVRLPSAVRYIGCDVVPEMIAVNQARFGDDRHEFMVRDIIRDVLPRGDLIMCRDCLIHLPHRQALKAVARFKESGATYVAFSHQTWVEANRDVHLGGHRPLNLQKPPFSFPPPLRMVFDGDFAMLARHEAGLQRDPKHLAVWRLADL